MTSRAPKHAPSGSAHLESETDDRAHHHLVERLIRHVRVRVHLHPNIGGQTSPTVTPVACAASASMSAPPPVRTVPPGSAIATTTASTAEPRILCSERANERHRCLGALRGTRRSTAVENQRGSTDSVGRTLPDATCGFVRGGLLSLAGLSRLIGEFVEISVGFSEWVLSFQPGTKCDLEELQSWEVALPQLFMEVLGQIQRTPPRRDQRTEHEQDTGSSDVTRGCRRRAR